MSIEEPLTSISVIIEAARQAQEFNRQLEAIMRPRLEDLGLMPRLYEQFAGFSQRKSSECRKQFILIALYFYAPGVFIGSSVPSLVKKALAGLFQMSTRNIEYLIENALGMYKIYSNFRTELKDGIEYIKPASRTVESHCIFWNNILFIEMLFVYLCYKITT